MPPVVVTLRRRCCNICCERQTVAEAASNPETAARDGRLRFFHYLKVTSQAFIKHENAPKPTNRQTFKLLLALNHACSWLLIAAHCTNLADRCRRSPKFSSPVCQLENGPTYYKI
jgi:hypothetical protein